MFSLLSLFTPREIKILYLTDINITLKINKLKSFIEINFIITHTKIITHINQYIKYNYKNIQ